MPGQEDFERRREIVRSMNVMDDDLFAKIAEDVPAMEEILSVFLQEPELQLLWSRPQVHIRNCGTRSVTLDAMCESVSGTLYSVEMQKSSRDDHQRRVRYNPLFPKLSARVQYLKEDRKGVEYMCEAVEKYAQEKAKEAVKKAKKEAQKEAKAAAKNSAALLFQNGVRFEIVAKSIKQLTRKELEKIYQAAH